MCLPIPPPPLDRTWPQLRVIRPELITTSCRKGTKRHTSHSKAWMLPLYANTPSQTQDPEGLPLSLATVPTCNSPDHQSLTGTMVAMKPISRYETRCTPSWKALAGFCRGRSNRWQGAASDSVAKLASAPSSAQPCYKL